MLFLKRCDDEAGLACFQFKPVSIIKKSFVVKILFSVCYTNRKTASLTFFCHYKNNKKNCKEMGLLSLSNLEICIIKAEFSDFKGYKFHLGLLNAYNPMYYDRNISENKDGKKSEGSCLFCVTNGEFYL